MNLRATLPAVRFAAIVVATVIFVRAAFAQDDGTNPFAQMRGGLGEQLMGPRIISAGDNMSSPVNSSDYGLPRYWGSQTLFVPRIPPALDEGLIGPAPSDSDFAPDCARETFYGGASVLARRDQLPEKQIERITVYRNNRQQLLNEIRAKFDELAAATPAARKAGLAELAAQQESRLRSLDDDAEAIRSDVAWVKSILGIVVVLRDGAIRYGRSAQGPSPTVVRYGPDRPEPRDSPRMFSAAYFHAGLSTEQRHLLPEIAYELAREEKNEGPEGKIAGASGFFFLPATARIRLPADLPPALEEKIRGFAREKENLKSELRTAVLRDDYFFVVTRTRRLAELAEQQAPRFAALHALAEEIRIGLAGLGSLERSGNTGLPADLTQRMGSFNARKVEVRRVLLNRLRELAAKHPAERFEIVRQGHGLAIVQAGTNPKPVAGLDEFNAWQARQYTAFAGESEILRRDIQHYLEGSPQRGTRTVDQLAGDFAKAYAARENEARYRDYSRAVLEPGLSAAQRRLLFQSATTALGRPGGSIHP
jgi:hypothetical protein